MKDEKEKLEIEEELAIEYGSALFQKRYGSSVALETLIVLGIPLLITIGLHFGFQTSWWVSILVYIVGFIAILFIIASFGERLISQKQLAKVRHELTEILSQQLEQSDFLCYETVILTMYKKKILFNDARQFLKNFGVQIEFDELKEKLEDLEKMDKTLFKEKMQDIRDSAVQRSSIVDSSKAQAAYSEKIRELSTKATQEASNEENETTDVQSQPSMESSKSTESDLPLVEQ